MTYQNFGPNGPEFEAVRQEERQIGKRTWEKLEGQSGLELPAFDRAWNAVFGRSPVLYNQFASLTDSVDEGAVREVWRSWQRLFNPPLYDWNELSVAFSDETSGEMMFLQVVANAPSLDHALVDRINRMKGICYAPFRDDEVAWLLSRYQLLEFGAGGFYFANHFRQSGGDVVAIENDAYGTLSRGAMSTWTLDFIKHGQLEIGGVDKIAPFAKNRALVIGAPHPGSIAPRDAIRAYREAGGEVLLVKMAGYFSTPAVEDGLSKKQRRANVVSTLLEIASHWRLLRDPSTPPYLPEYFASDMLAFELAV